MWGAVQVLTLLFGVYDNSKILSHTLHQLACHPGAQQTAREEVDAAWGGQPPRTIQALISLRYLHACLQVGSLQEEATLHMAYTWQHFEGFFSALWSTWAALKPSVQNRCMIANGGNMHDRPVPGSPIKSSLRHRCYGVLRSGGCDDGVMGLRDGTMVKVL